MRRRTIFLLTLFIMALNIYCANPRRYITQNGSGLRDGSSWENAGGAEELENIIDSIQDADFWIAKGSYKPSRYVYDPENERDMTFLPNHNNIYGGFAGNETELSQRDIKANETIFSGDIGIEGDNSDNCYHVMRAVPILDGVTICDGNANGSSNPNYYGGGVYVWGYDSIFRNCTFRDNYARAWGGAVFMDTWGYDVVFENCLFYNNEAEEGGALFSSYDVTTVNNCTFVKNTTDNGGCVSLPHWEGTLNYLTNNIFWKNIGDNLGYLPYIYNTSHNAIEGGYVGFANINLSSNNTGDTNSPYFTDPDNHDYSLQSVSPLIDAGVYWNASCETDITGQLRPQGSGWDIGAYEYDDGPLTTVPPTVSTLSPEFITVSTARVRGNVTDDGGSQMITKGVYYGTYSGFDPETEGTFVKYNELYSEGEFYIDMTDLSPGRYYYRIFCENSVGSAIGEEMDFFTRSGVNPDANGILYVKTDGTGDGSSWVNALHGNDLQLGINEPAVKEIWLAEGKYVPTSWPCTQLKGADFEITDDFAYKMQEDSLKAKGITEFKMNGTTEREKHFMLRANLPIYGGFTGTETALEQRDFRNNKTVLSGDIGAEGEYYDNTYHVIYHYYNPDIDSTAVLDGVTVSDGNADGTIMGDSPLGGGMFSRTSSPTIRNCVFENNRAVYGGGIMNGYSGTYGPSMPLISNTRISDNTALDSGGGIYDIGAFPYLKNSVITNNSTENGGAVYHNGDAGEYDGDLRIVHCTIAGNKAEYGSQILLDTWIFRKAYFYNCIIWGDLPAVVWDNGSYPPETSQYTYLYNTGIAGSYNGYGDGNILLSELNEGQPNSPYFISPEGNDYSISYGSACRDMASYRYSVPFDITGNPRPSGAAYDMGAYELMSGEPIGSAPSVITGGSGPLTVSTAACSTLVADDGGSLIFKRGVKYSVTNGFDPEYFGTLIFKDENYTDSGFTTQITGLAAGTHYYYRSYAENRMGYSYGDQKDFITPDLTPGAGGVFYVTPDGSGNGSTWTQSLNGKDIQSAIDHAQTKQIWIAEGVYKPNSWPKGGYSERMKHFSLRNGVSLYGGFNGTESSVDQRDFRNNLTVFSGDIGKESDSLDNCYHIFVNLDIPDSAVVDGFTITGSNEDVYNIFNLWYRDGGAMHNENASLKIANCIFSDNYAVGNGGAVFNLCEPERIIFKIEFDNCSFVNNSSTGNGGAVISGDDYHNVFDGCSFINNTADESPAIYSYGSEFSLTEIYNSLFYGNRSVGGGCISLDRRDRWSISEENNKVINCTFAKNTTSGIGTGGIDLFNSSGMEHYIDIRNTVFFNNDSDDIYLFESVSPPDIYNCAFDYALEIPHWGENNITISPNNTGDPYSPYFCDPVNNNWMIQENSPLRDAGIWTDDVPLYDIAGYLRDSAPDIGCYEYDPTSIEDDEGSLPQTTKLYQNYPNPFNPATNIKFSISREGKVELTVYNVLGQVVDKLVEGNLKAGNHSVVFNADALNSGVYYYSLKTDAVLFSKKMLIVK